MVTYLTHVDTRTDKSKALLILWYQMTRHILHSNLSLTLIGKMGNTNLCVRWIANEPNRLARFLIKLTEQYNVNGKVQIIDAHSQSYVFVLYWVFSSAVDPKQSAGACICKYGATMADGGAGEGGGKRPVVIEEKKGKFPFTLTFSFPIFIITSHLARK